MQEEENASYLEQTTINQRIKFLLEHFNLSARDFGRAIGAPDNTTQNYLGTRQTKPNAEYIEKLLRHFESVEARWLLTGQGEPFASKVAEPGASYQIQKKNKGNVVGTNHGTISQQQGDKSDCEKELAVAQHTIALLSSQLLDKERLIKLYENQTFHSSHPSPPK
jgi:hypothetical protein